MIISPFILSTLLMSHLSIVNKLFVKKLFVNKEFMISDIPLSIRNFLGVFLNVLGSIIPTIPLLNIGIMAHKYVKIKEKNI